MRFATSDPDKYNDGTWASKKHDFAREPASKKFHRTRKFTALKIQIAVNPSPTQSRPFGVKRYVVNLPQQKCVQQISADAIAGILFVRQHHLTNHLSCWGLLQKLLFQRRQILKTTFLNHAFNMVTRL
jgi:hypothetical protein